MRSFRSIFLPLLILAACGKGGDTSPDGASDARTSGAVTPGAEPGSGQASAPVAAAPADSSPPVAGPGVGESRCTPEAPGAASASWPRYTSPSGAFSFAHPAGWETVDIRFRVTGAFDSTSYAEAGLPADTKTGFELVRDPAGFPNVAVYTLERVRSQVDTLYARQEAKFRSIPQLKQILRTNLTRCIGGAPALGLDFVFMQDLVDLETGEQTASDEEAYQQSWYATADGTLYHIQFLAQDSSAAGVLDEVLRTWRWSPADGQGAAAAGADTAGRPTPGEAEAPAPGAAGETAPAFGEAHIASAADPSAEGPDPATYTTTFPATASAIYVVYRLREGAGGRVTFAWRKDGAVIFQNAEGQRMPDDGTWAFEAIQPPSGGFPPGSYEVILTLAETGEARSLPFTVTE